MEFHVSTLDNPNDFPPTMHVYHGERIEWVKTGDELPRHDFLPT